MLASTVASHQEGPLNALVLWGPSVLSFHSLTLPVWALTGYYSFLPQSEDMHVRLIGNSKLICVSGRKWMGL